MISLRFRPLGFDDLSLLHGWLHQPHVAAWWNEPLDLRGVRAKYGPRITGEEPTRVFVIERERPIGWIQWYRWSDYPVHAAHLGADPRDAGIDVAIGDPAAIGFGLGTRAIATFVDQEVFSHSDVAACLTDPDERNTRSIRAFERAGFAVVRTVCLPGELGSRKVVRRGREPLLD